MKAKLELHQEMAKGFIKTFQDCQEATIDGLYHGNAIKLVYSQGIVALTMLEGYIRECMLKTEFNKTDTEMIEQVKAKLQELPIPGNSLGQYERDVADWWSELCEIVGLSDAEIGGLDG